MCFANVPTEFIAQPKAPGRRRGRPGDFSVPVLALVTPMNGTLRRDLWDAAGNRGFREILGCKLHIQGGLCAEQKLDEHQSLVQSGGNPAARQAISRNHIPLMRSINFDLAKSL